MPAQPPKNEALLRVLGENISKTIKKRGYQTIEEFAWEQQIPKSTMSRIVLGQNDVRISKLVRIAKALGVKVDDLLSKKDPS